MIVGDDGGGRETRSRNEEEKGCLFPPSKRGIEGLCFWIGLWLFDKVD